MPSTRRRTFLRSTACVGLLAATSGCLEAELEAAEQEPEPLSDRFSHEEVDLPVQQRLAVAADAIEAADEAEIDDLDAFEAYLTERDVEVESLESAEVDGEPILELEYVATDAVDRGLLDRVGHVAGGFAVLVDAGDESELLEATVLDPASEPYGAFDVERTWAEEYHAGELPAREFAGEVVGTLETRTDG